MDTITHALSGALLARATEPRQTRAGMPERGPRAWIGALSAAFPDIDYLLNWVDPVVYLDLHRGPTHSLLWMPLWALLLSIVLRVLTRGRYSFLALFQVCILGIGIHIAGDVITVYGTRIWVPIQDAAVTLSTTFIIDLILTGIIVAGLVAGIRLNARRSARSALAVLIVYVTLQAWLHNQALDIAARYAKSLSDSSTVQYAIPQPLSPLHWKLVVVEGDLYHEAYLKLYGQPTAPAGDGWLRNILASYLPPEKLQWTKINRWGNDHRIAHTARKIFLLPALGSFRRFAVLPVLYRVDNDDCLWFTDLRFVIADMTPPFRYGLCQAQVTSEWTLRRLPRLERQ